MPANEREWAKEPLPAERIQEQKADFLDDDLTNYELSDTGRFERSESVTLGWGDVLFWVCVMVLVRMFT